MGFCMFPFLEIFGRQIPLYGLCLVVGTVIGVLLLYLTASKKGLLRDDALYSALYALIGGLLGAKLLYLLTVLPILVGHFADFSGSFSALYALFAGGYVYYGGLLGGVFAMWLYSRQFQTPFLPYLDHAAIFLPLVHAFGRVGCYFAGCCYGIPYQGIFAVSFPPETLGLAGVALFPVQLLESLLNLLLFWDCFLPFANRASGASRGDVSCLLRSASIRPRISALRRSSRFLLVLFHFPVDQRHCFFQRPAAALFCRTAAHFITLSRQKNVI